MDSSQLTLVAILVSILAIIVPLLALLRKPAGLKRPVALDPNKKVSVVSVMLCTVSRVKTISLRTAHTHVPFFCRLISCSSQRTKSRTTLAGSDSLFRCVCSSQVEA